ncbi:Tartrate dehydrogenase/decarboxylase [compost metagenome]
MIWSGALMLDFLGNGEGACRAAHDDILRAIEQVIAEGRVTRDMGGEQSTQQVGEAIAGLVQG